MAPTLMNRRNLTLAVIAAACLSLVVGIQFIRPHKVRRTEAIDTAPPASTANLLTTPEPRAAQAIERKAFSDAREPDVASPQLAVISARVLSQEGHAIAGARVSAPDHGAVTSTDSFGIARLTIGGSNLVTLSCRAAGYSQQSIDVACVAGQLSDVEIVLAPLAFVEVSVRHGASPVSGCRVGILGDVENERWVVSDINGVARLYSPIARTLIRCIHDDFEPAELWITVAAGPNTAVVNLVMGQQVAVDFVTETLEPYPRISVSVRIGSAGASFGVITADDLGRITVTRRKGQFLGFDEPPDADYTIISGRILPPDAETARVVIRRVTVLRCRVLTSDGRDLHQCRLEGISGAGVATNRESVALDGFHLVGEQGTPSSPLFRFVDSSGWCSKWRRYSSPIDGREHVEIVLWPPVHITGRAVFRDGSGCATAAIIATECAVPTSEGAPLTARMVVPADNTGRFSFFSSALEGLRVWAESGKYLSRTIVMVNRDIYSSGPQPSEGTDWALQSGATINVGDITLEEAGTLIAVVSRPLGGRAAVVVKRADSSVVGTRTRTGLVDAHGVARFSMLSPGNYYVAAIERAVGVNSAPFAEISRSVVVEAGTVSTIVIE